MLVSHVHGDHLGNRHIARTGEGSCTQPVTPIDAMPDSNSVRIAVKKDALMVTGREMPRFLASKLKSAGGDAEKSRLVRFGGMTSVNGINISTVPAMHSNGLDAEFIEGSLGEALQTVGFSAYVGPATGYIIRFRNGLVVYLSSDTGTTAEQKILVHDYYHARLAVINIGDTLITGPKEAAYVVNELVKPASVIASHANEAATDNGKLIGGTCSAQFIKAYRMPVYLPLSGRTMQFNREGRCVKGC